MWLANLFSNVKVGIVSKNMPYKMRETSPPRIMVPSPKMLETEVDLEPKEVHMPDLSHLNVSDAVKDRTEPITTSAASKNITRDMYENSSDSIQMNYQNVIEKRKKRKKGKDVSSDSVSYRKHLKLHIRRMHKFLVIVVIASIVCFAASMVSFMAYYVVSKDNDKSTLTFLQSTTAIVLENTNSTDVQFESTTEYSSTTLSTTTYQI